MGDYRQFFGFSQKVIRKAFRVREMLEKWIVEG